MTTAFQSKLGQHKNNIALLSLSQGSMTYSELLDKISTIFNYSNDKCLSFCFCKNNFESVVGYLGFLYKNTVSIMLNEDLEYERQYFLYNLYKPQFIWLPTERTDQFHSCSILASWKSYSLISTPFQNNLKIFPQLALMLTTSGSTGSPKFVRLSYKNLDANAKSIAEYLDIKQIDKSISTMPMSYSFGLSIINSYLLSGATICLTEYTLLEKEFWTTFKKLKVTSISGVPYLFKILKKLRFFDMDLPSLRIITQAGGKLDKQLAYEFAVWCSSRGIRFYIMYGQTEATARLSYLPPEYSMKTPGSIGIPIPGGKFWLEDENQQVVKNKFCNGELVFKGTNVSLGYAINRQDLSKGDDNKGVLKTGDIAHFDEHELYYITGRKNRFLKIFGNRINLDEIEMLLNDKGFNNVCTGTDDNLLIYTTNKGSKPLIEKFICNKIGINKVAFTVLVIHQIPRSDSGKILYSSLG